MTNGVCVRENENKEGTGFLIGEYERRTVLVERM